MLCTFFVVVIDDLIPPPPFPSGIWCSPEISGIKPLLCSDFSFSMVDSHHAVLFGGNLSGQPTNRVFVLDVNRMVRSYLMDTVTLSTSHLIH